MNTKLAVLLIPVLAACGSAGSRVVPLNVSAAEYANWTCQKLADEQMRLSIAMTVGSAEAETAHTLDQRREYDAISLTSTSRKCGTPKPIVAWIN
jgi:hypothetical protein